MADQTTIEFIIELVIDYHQRSKTPENSQEKLHPNQQTNFSEKWFGMLPNVIKHTFDSKGNQD
ncbi:hypothetical protein [Amphibacillus cookii]|uniref:hypothetical protein n=1 Tax=Amphibacillus cookii TaxID=767787 RepID=UPI001956A3D2|nr:hypothetical protein [Amphibacillus cookii]MBM7542417.1 hypothetical protein [Amphibacillus cookii]